MLPSLIQLPELLDKPLPALFCGVLGDVQQCSNLLVSHFLRVLKIKKAAVIGIKAVDYLGQSMHIGIMDTLVKERVEKLREANPDMDETAIPVDLVTCSGSGLDPHISPAAAEYQVARIAKANDMTEDEVREMIRKCTDGKFLGIFGEETVNVLKVNLMLDGIL